VCLWNRKTERQKSFQNIFFGTNFFIFQNNKSGIYKICSTKICSENISERVIWKTFFKRDKIVFSKYDGMQKVIFRVLGETLKDKFHIFWAHKLGPYHLGFSSNHILFQPRQLLPAPPWLLPAPHNKNTFTIVPFSKKILRKIKYNFNLI